MLSHPFDSFGKPLAQVLLRVGRRGLCHSDVRLHEGYFDPGDAQATKAFLNTSGGASAVTDFVGAATTFVFGLSALRKGSQLVCVGHFGGVRPLMPATLPLRAVSIIGPQVGSPAEMGEMMALARKGTLPALPLSTRTMTEVNQALRDLRGGAIRGRVMLQP